MLSRLNFLKRLDARARILVLVGAVLGVILLVYLGTRLIWSGSNTTGPSRIATAPQGLQSIPGGQLTPEYQQALQQANVQAAQQAQLRGGSAVPTMINIGTQVSAPGNCIVCTDQSANVRNFLDDWVRQGQISPEVATALQQLADKNPSVEDYAAALDQLVKEGKLTPEQARLLLDQYKKQHANALLAESGKTMDGLIKAGQLPIDVANQLLDAQRNKMTPAQYGALLQDLAAQGKISPATAQQLLGQYTQQRAREVVARSIASLRQMLRAGQITPDVEKNLEDLETKLVPVDAYAAVLQKYVTDGKMTPVVANKILNEFKGQKAEIGPSATINQLLQAAEAAAYAELRDLLNTKQITPDVAGLIGTMIQQNVSFAQFKATIDSLVQQRKLTPQIAQFKLADYQKVKGLRDLAQQLAALQGNNASPNDYANQLRQAVQAGLITPEEAARLMQEYQGMTAGPGPTTLASGPGSEQFAQLQQRVQQGAAPTAVSPEQFAVAAVQAQVETDQDRQARLQALMAAMQAQAQQLVAAWQPPVMVRKMGAAEVKTTTTTTTGSGAGSTTTTTTGAGADTSGIPIIKAGTVLFAVLDTAVNSDYPTTPVMATIVSGKYKGAKLLGKFVTTKGVAGQMDRISLNFTLMNMDEWPKSKAIQAFAIDPDTARAVMASSVDYHYLKRYGAIMASAFLQGYASAITTSGATATTGIFGTSTQYPQLDPRQKIFVGLGQVGQTMGAAVQNYINIPPTVRVDSGVGLGILFMQDVGGQDVTGGQNVTVVQNVTP